MIPMQITYRYISNEKGKLFHIYIIRNENFEEYFNERQSNFAIQIKVDTIGKCKLLKLRVGEWKNI